MEIGTLVKVATPDGIVDGMVMGTARSTKNQMCVEFNFPSSGCAGYVMFFSKKTGMPYMHPSLRDMGIRVIV